MQQGFFAITRTCPQCHGAGEIISSPCPECHGSGHVKGKAALTVKIPAGIEDQSRLRIAGEGEAGGPDGPRGDLYVLVRVKPHEFFEREHNNLMGEISISFTQAAWGVTVAVPTLFGEERLKVPAGTQSGEVFRLKGKGLRDLGSQRLGDLYIRVRVRTPERLSREEKALVRDLARSRGEELEDVVPGRLEKRERMVH
jgi:molecular chaperone DnaJ